MNLPEMAGPLTKTESGGGRSKVKGSDGENSGHTISQMVSMRVRIWCMRRGWLTFAISSRVVHRGKVGRRQAETLCQDGEVDFPAIWAGNDLGLEAWVEGRGSGHGVRFWREG